MRSNALGERFTWFQEQIGEERTEPLSGVEFDELIVGYLHRFDEELEQINLKQSISKGRAHQHHSRLNAINITVEKETSDYNGGGWGVLNTNNKELLNITELTCMPFRLHQSMRRRQIQDVYGVGRQHAQSAEL